MLDERAGIDMDIGLRCFGEYSYRIVNPMLFYTNVCGNMAEEYRREKMCIRDRFCMNSRMMLNDVKNTIIWRHSDYDRR